MRRRVLIGVGVLVVLLAATQFFIVLPAGAAWDEKITGGGQAIAGGVHFSITVSAWEDSTGSAAGQMEYSRAGQSMADLSMHITVECLGVWDDRAVAAGPAWTQYDPGNWYNPANWVIVNIHEGGIGAGDTVRVYQSTPGAAALACNTFPTSFPGTVYDGNFNIRSK
jgi:hypothetical protein